MTLAFYFSRKNKLIAEAWMLFLILLNCYSFYIIPPCTIIAEKLQNTQRSSKAYWSLLKIYHSTTVSKKLVCN